MSSDYRAIRKDNVGRYGTDIGRIGKMLLADRYTVRTHFIFELLQNAEDALARRTGWEGSRAVKFHLTEKALRVSHFGRPFDDADVRGICGIDESTKDLTAIGRFGIGFKSVFAFTNRPEIHSGAEDFAIESFVWPVASSPLTRDAEETIIELPLNEADAEGHDEIGAGLGRLGASALMFLRQIEDIHWSIEGGRSGLYLRQPDEVATNVRRVGETLFLQVRDAGDGEKWFANPNLAYLATERLKRLFAGIKEIYLADDTYACLRGEDIRDLLEACGAVRYLRTDPVSSLSWDERHDLRVQAGHEDTSGQNDRIDDRTLRGLEKILEAMPHLEPEERNTRAEYLWEELAHLEERRGKGVFVAEYTWTHYGSYRQPFDAAFMRQVTMPASSAYKTPPVKRGPSPSIMAGLLSLRNRLPLEERGNSGS